MDTDFARKLTDQNTAFYAQNAQSFSATRGKPWPGWIDGAKILQNCFCSKSPHSKSVQGGKIKIIDFAAGNLRFEEFLLSVSWYARNVEKITAVDNCLPISSCAKILENYQVDFVESDLMENVFSRVDLGQIFAPSDLVCCFGFFHHIPSFTNRVEFFQQLINCTISGGFLFMSFWQFAEEESVKTKAIKTTKEFLSKNPSFSKSQFENDDYLIGWQNKSDAFRYCHNFNNLEIDKLLAHFDDQTQIVAKFSGTGSDKQNAYLILRKR